MKPKSQLEKRVDALEENGGGSGGVGEAVGNHSERFNYSGSESGVSTIDDSNGGMANRAGGYNNSLKSCQFTDVYGYDCLVEMGRCAIIRGDSIDIKQVNNLNNLNSFIIVGQSINNYDRTAATPVPGPIRASAIFGISHSLRSRVNGSLIVGDSITVNAPVYNSIIAGIYHTISGQVYNCIVGGTGANVTPITSLAIGNNGNIFHVDTAGDVTARSYNTNGADYAEMFEWQKRLKAGERRTGMLVALCGDRIIPAHGNEIVGIISAAASVIGNNPIYWHGKYKTDVFGAVVRDENGCAIISEKYDPGKEYILRSQRPEEWGIVGLTGRIVIVDDGSCMVGGYVSARHGIGTKCFAKTAVKVLRRIDESHVEVLIR